MLVIFLIVSPQRMVRSHAHLHVSIHKSIGMQRAEPREDVAANHSHNVHIKTSTARDTGQKCLDRIITLEHLIKSRSFNQFFSYKSYLPHHAHETVVQFTNDADIYLNITSLAPFGIYAYHACLFRVPLQMNQVRTHIELHGKIRGCHV